MSEPVHPETNQRFEPEWRTHRLFGLTLASDFAFSNRLAPGRDAPDLTFTCVRGSTPGGDRRMTSPLYISSHRTSGGEPILAIHRLEERDVLRFPGVADFSLWPDRIVCHLPDSACHDSIEIRLLGTVLAYWLERRGIPVLHAGAVVVEDRAVAFLSLNGGGKTSLAASLMQAGHPLLSDDILALETQAGVVMGQPGYPQMRMWPDQARHFWGHDQVLEMVHPGSDKRRVPVGSGGLGAFCEAARPVAVLYLPERRDPTRGDEITITPTPPAQALLALLSHCFVSRLFQPLGNPQRRLAFFAGLVERVPVRHLAYPDGLEFLPRLRRAILEDMRKIR